VSATMRTALAAALAALLSLSAACRDEDAGAGGASATTTTTGAGAGGATTGVGGAGGAGTAGAGGEAAGGAGGGAPSGYGALSGTCGVINLDDIESPAPQVVENAIDLTGRPAFDPLLLSPGGQEIFEDGNLGGSSLYSEIFAYEVLYRCDGAALLKTEAEIVYAIDGKKTDLLVEIDGAKVGVSVVRAVSFPEGAAYPVWQALDVLEDKLADILLSSANVAPEDAWEKQIVSVVAQSPEHASAIEQAYAMIDAGTKADTIVVITVTDGDDAYIYYNN